MRKQQLRLVQPAPKFDPEKFKTKQPQEGAAKPRPVSRRPAPARTKVKFIRLPHMWARRLRKHRVNATAWYLIVELDRLIHEPGKGNPVKLSTKALESMELSLWAAKRALRQLEEAGAVTLTRRRGRAPLVDATWYRDL
jgi:hypothetical protein